MQNEIKERFRKRLEKAIKKRTEMNAPIRKKQKNEEIQKQQDEQEQSINIVLAAINVLNSYPTSKEFIQSFEVTYCSHSGRIYFYVHGHQKNLTIKKIEKLEEQINNVGTPIKIAYIICKFLEENFPNQPHGGIFSDNPNTSDFFYRINF